MNNPRQKKTMNIMQLMGNEAETKVEATPEIPVLLDAGKLKKYDISVLGKETEIIDGVTTEVYVMSKSTFQYRAYADGTPTPKGRIDLQPLGGNPFQVQTEQHIINMTKEALADKDLSQRVLQTLTVLSFVVDHDKWEQQKVDLAQMSEKEKSNKTHLLLITDDMVYGDTIPYANYEDDIKNQQFVDALIAKRPELVKGLIADLGTNDIIGGYKALAKGEDLSESSEETVKNIPTTSKQIPTMNDEVKDIEISTKRNSKKKQVVKKKTGSKVFKNKMNIFKRVTGTGNIKSEYTEGYAPYSGLKYRIKPINTITKARTIYDHFDKLNQFDNMKGLVEVLTDAFSEMELMVSDKDNYNLVESGMDIFHYKDIKYILISVIQASGVRELNSVKYSCSSCGESNIESKPILLRDLSINMTAEQLKTLEAYDTTKTYDEVTKDSELNKSDIVHEQVFDFEKGTLEDSKWLNVNRSVVKINSTEPNIRKHVVMRTLGWASLKMAVITALSKDGFVDPEEIIMGIGKMGDDEFYDLAQSKCKEEIAVIERDMTLAYCIENVTTELYTRDLIKNTVSDYSVKLIESYDMDLLEDIFEAVDANGKTMVNDPHRNLLDFIDNLTEEQEQFLIDHAIIPEEETNISIRTECDNCDSAMDLVVGLPVLGFTIFQEKYTNKM